MPVSSCGIASTTSTFAPMRVYTVANSRPITPPPTISMFLGMRLICTASSELMIVSPSCGHAPTSIGAEPVAMTIGLRRVLVGRAVFLLQRHDVLADERRVAVRELHVVRFEELVDAADVGLDDLVRELRDAFAVDFGFGDLQPELAGVVDLARDLTDVQQRLSRDAAPVQAHAADLVAVEAHDFLAELAEPDRGVIAARAGADDERVD